MFGLLEGALYEALVTILLAGLSLATAYGVAALRAGARAVQARTKWEIGERAIARTVDLVASTVASLEQTVARDLRSAVKDGKAGREELLTIGNRAVEDVLEHLGSEGRNALEATVDYGVGFVRDLIEAQVLQMKKAGKA